MKHLLPVFQVASLIVSILVSRVIHAVIVSKLSRGTEQGQGFLATPGGSAILFGLTFVVVWFMLSFLAVFGWMLLRRAI